MTTIALTRDGSIYWNGTRVSGAQFSQYLRISHGLNPEPTTFLETEMGVSCRALDAVRDEMDRSLECKRPYGRCAEGIQSVWQDLPTPPGEPIS